MQSDHVKKQAFRDNFFAEFKKVLDKNRTKEKNPIKSYKECDFSVIRAHLLAEKEIKQGRSKEEKNLEKALNVKITEAFGWANIDNRKERVGNFKLEPPGLFLGRGEHPKTGMLKSRIRPSDVTLNIAEGVEIPVPCQLVPTSVDPRGYRPMVDEDGNPEEWGSVIHNNEVSWLAFWKENINNHFKYVWLSASSSLKGKSDLRKFEKARELSRHIDNIRTRYMAELTPPRNAVECQRSTALWLIDNLALRVGNEKGEDEADTVGCCSLRVEHITLMPDFMVKLSFLGKDSMLFEKVVKVIEPVYLNFKAFIKGKKPTDDLFDELTTTMLNAYLKTQMAGLTAKVFRTFNASITLEKELEKMPGNLKTVEEKLLFYNRANRQVAILCNHQRSLPKTFTQQMDRLNEKVFLFLSFLLLIVTCLFVFCSDTLFLFLLIVFVCWNRSTRSRSRSRRPRPT